MMEISEQQKKRAVNIIWNAAKRYDFSPDFKAYDEDGKAELYWNCILGAARRHYDYPKLETLFASLQQEEDEEIYTGLLWLGLENCIYERERRDRPALERLRKDYAKRYVQRYAGTQPDDYHLYDCLALAHYMRILGMTPRISTLDRKLLDALEFPSNIDTDEIVRRAQALLRQWFQIRAEERHQERKPFSFGRGRPRRKTDLKLRKFGLGFAEHTAHGQVDGGDKKNLNEDLRTKMSASELRAFMTTKYGRALFTAKQMQEIERELCKENHQSCHLHFTKGERVKGQIQNGFEALQREKEAAQIARNRSYYQANLARNRTSISKLANKIQNSILLYLQPTAIKSDTGSLNGGLAWRAIKLDDNRVFTRKDRGESGDLCVDILLDASTSQMNRQEIVSSQGYMIAEALNRCGIPCRVMSFCSMTGYTILRIYRDYRETGKNESIFEYVSNGCNRDGLAIRASHYLISQSPYEHRILIILSDVKPNDIIWIQNAEGEGATPYEQDAGVNDTAWEVRKARADGISVVCVFTGEDADLPSAQKVYGRDFARILSLDKLADTVGLLLQNQIRNL